MISRLINSAMLALIVANLIIWSLFYF